MTVPSAYDSASRDFYRFLADAKDAATLVSTHQTYTMVEGVFIAFRARLTTRQALHFADELPLLLRALFVAGLNVDAPVLPFADRETMTREVQALRGDHNFAPDTAIADVAVALRKAMGDEALDRALEGLPDEARAFWQT